MFAEFEKSVFEIVEQIDRDGRAFSPVARMPALWPAISRRNAQTASGT